MPAPIMHLSTAAKIEASDRSVVITVRRGTVDDRAIAKINGRQCRLLHEGRWLTLKFTDVSIVNGLAVWRAG